jgi:hypothetical protein
LTPENVEDLSFIREQYKVKGRNNLLLVWRILQVVKGYTSLTVRQLYYILVSRFKYSANIVFYKKMNRYLCKVRRANAEVHVKFIDPTRQFIPAPLPCQSKEIWVEKDSIRNFIAKLATRYRLSIQVLRGFASLSMYRKALERARRRGVTTVLYIGDHDPSGLLIETIAQEEMDHKRGIIFYRLAITMEQIRRFKPPSRPVNTKDSRAQAYIEKYGNRVWDVEAIKPRTLHHLIELGLREAVPPEFLAEAETREKASRIARPVTERLRKTIEKEVAILLEMGVPEEEILAQISEKYAIKPRDSKNG